MKLQIKQSFFIIFSFCLLACNEVPKKETFEKNNTLKIGAILPLTGKLSEMGQIEKKGMDLALEDFKDNDIKVEVIYEDSKSSSKESVTAARRLLDKNVDIVLTSTTSVSLATQPIFTENKKNLIAYCMDENVASMSPYVVRYYQGTTEESLAIKSYFSNSFIDHPKIGIIYAQVAALEKVVSNNLKPFFQEKNVNISLIESYRLFETDFKVVVSKIKDKEIDHLIVLGYGFSYPEMFSELSRQKILDNLTILGGWGFLYPNMDKSLMEGVLVAGPKYMFSKGSNALIFEEKYKKRYNQIPNFDAAFAYEVIKQLSSLNKSDFDKPIQEILNNTTKTGVIGEYSFKNGNLIIDMAIGKYTNGEIQILY